jgi:hypothetical protein
MRLSGGVALAALVLGGCAAAIDLPTPVGELIISEVPERGAGLFAGSASCAGCHPEAFSRWQATAHARPFSGLPAAERRSAACLRCHVTGYGLESGYSGSRDDLDLANVGCESCHGPGADHGCSAHPELVPTLTGGECPPCEVNRVCRLCHTPERSADFNLARALARITCSP